MPQAQEDKTSREELQVGGDGSVSGLLSPVLEPAGVPGLGQTLVPILCCLIWMALASHLTHFLICRTGAAVLPHRVGVGGKEVLCVSMGTQHRVGREFGTHTCPPWKGLIIPRREHRRWVQTPLRTC